MHGIVLLIFISVVVSTWLAVASLDGFVAILAMRCFFGAFVFSRACILALLASDFTFAYLDTLIAVVANSIC